MKLRMQGSFLFVGTAEGALYRILLLAYFSDTHTHTLSLFKPSYVKGKHQQHMYLHCKHKSIHIFTLLLANITQTTLPH